MLFVLVFVASACAISATNESSAPGKARAAIDFSGGIPKAEGSQCATTRRGGFAGLGGDSFIHPEHRDCILGLQAAAGAGVLRLTMDWKIIESQQGVYDWAEWDTWFQSAATHRMKVLPILFNTPRFYGKQATTGSYPPRSSAPFGRFVRAAVERYGRGGDFFAENPGVPRVPITDWQIWNEPNLMQYWRPRVNPRGYVNLLKTAYKNVKAADPQGQVVTAGIPDSTQSGAVQVRPFVTRLYAAGGAKYFDVLAANLYGKNAQHVMELVNDLRLLMDAPKAPSLLRTLFRSSPAKRSTLRALVRDLPRSQRKRNVDPKAKIWLTEIGWGTGGPAHRFNIGASRQAKELRKLLRAAYGQRGKLRLRGIIYFGWQDLEPYPPAFADQWGLHTGLFQRNGTPKPGYNAFKSVAPGLK